MNINIKTRLGLPGHARVYINGVQVGLVSHEPDGWTYGTYVTGEQQPRYSEQFFGNRDLAVKGLIKAIAAQMLTDLIAEYPEAVGETMANFQIRSALISARAQVRLEDKFWIAWYLDLAVNHGAPQNRIDAVRAVVL